MPLRISNESETKVKTLIVFNRLMNEINYLTSAHDVETLNTFRPPPKKNKTKPS